MRFTKEFMEEIITEQETRKNCFKLPKAKHVSNIRYVKRDIHEIIYSSEWREGQIDYYFSLGVQYG